MRNDREINTLLTFANQQLSLLASFSVFSGPKNSSTKSPLRTLRTSRLINHLHFRICNLQFSIRASGPKSLCELRDLLVSAQQKQFETNPFLRKRFASLHRFHICVYTRKRRFIKQKTASRSERRFVEIEVC